MVTQSRSNDAEVQLGHTYTAATALNSYSQDETPLISLHGAPDVFFALVCVLKWFRGLLSRLYFRKNHLLLYVHGYTIVSLCIYSNWLPARQTAKGLPFIDPKHETVPLN